MYTDRLRAVKEIQDTVGDRSISISFDTETDTVTVQGGKGETYDHMLTYWMFWKGIYPETALHGAALQ